MMKNVLIVLSLMVIFLFSACEKKQPEPEQKKPVTLREKAQAVGKLGDQTMTKSLEKNLTHMVDTTDKRNKDLDKAVEEGE